MRGVENDGRFAAHAALRLFATCQESVTRVACGIFHATGTATMSLMENEEKQRWPYLSPARPGWELVDGVRGDVRALLLRGNADAIAEKRESNDAAGVVLDFIEDVNRLLVMLQNELIGLVTESYYRGVSWQDLARRLDRSKQSVHQRYHRRVHARATHESLRADLEVVLRRVQANPRPYPPESPGSPTASVGDSRSGKA